MTDPSHESPEPRQHDGRPSSVDWPYDTSSSGQLVPYSPSPSRPHTQDPIPWISGRQTSLHEEFNANDKEPSRPTLHQILRPTVSMSDIHADEHNHGQSPDPPAPAPVHPTVDFARSSSPSRGRSVSWSRPSGPPFRTLYNRVTFEAPRSETSVSLRSMSRTSMRSAVSFASARASYLEYHGPLPRARNPTFGIDTASVPVLETGSSSVPGRFNSLPNVNEPDERVDPIVDLDGPRFAPCSVFGVGRYSRRRRPWMISPTEIDYTISAMSYEYPETRDSIPNGWTAQRHPEGALYFMHSASKTFTEVDVYNEEIRADIEYFRDFLFSELRVEIVNRGLSESLTIDDVQLVLEPKIDLEGIVCCYYFVNPRSRSLFWLDEWEGDEIFCDCRGALSLPHKGNPSPIS
ncbi:hypothetical protein BU15DRAFT_76324 [Melanogaster broomeanus]|nr:hypothetical protein BU15DRAFT_76324 [Melanogaster broomeanus]